MAESCTDAPAQTAVELADTEPKLQFPGVWERVESQGKIAIKTPKITFFIDMMSFLLLPSKIIKEHLYSKTF
jgi:hypothetical protein